MERNALSNFSTNYLQRAVSQHGGIMSGKHILQATLSELSYITYVTQDVCLEQSASIFLFTKACFGKLCSVVATCRDPDGAAELQELARSHLDRLMILPMDVVDEGSIQARTFTTVEHAEERCVKVPCERTDVAVVLESPTWRYSASLCT